MDTAGDLKAGGVPPDQQPAGSPAYRSAAEDAAAEDGAEAGAGTNGEATATPEPNDLSLTLKGYAAANAVQTPEEEIDSPVADFGACRVRPRLCPPSWLAGRGLSVAPRT